MHKLLETYGAATTADEKSEIAQKISGEIKRVLSDEMAFCDILQGLEAFPELVEANLITLLKLFPEIHLFCDCQKAFSIVNSDTILEALMKKQYDADLTAALYAFFLCAVKDKEWWWPVLVGLFQKIENLHPKGAAMKRCIKLELKKFYQREDFDLDDSRDRAVYNFYGVGA